MTKQTKRTKQTKQTKKYEFTKEIQEFFGHTLHQIVATRNFGNVKAGDLGGFIETEGNLSHDGLCWVYDNARVCGKAWVCGNAWVCDNAQVFGDAKIKDQTRLTEGNHNGEDIKGTQADQSEEVTRLRQEIKELKAKLQRFLNVADSIAH